MALPAGADGARGGCPVDGIDEIRRRQRKAESSRHLQRRRQSHWHEHEIAIGSDRQVVGQHAGCQLDLRSGAARGYRHRHQVPQEVGIFPESSSARMSASRAAPVSASIRRANSCPPGAAAARAGMLCRRPWSRRACTAGGRCAGARHARHRAGQYCGKTK